MDMKKEALKKMACMPGYADGGEITDTRGIDAISGPQPGSTPPVQTPPIAQTMQTLNQTPNTNYDFFKNISAEDRMNLYKQLTQQQTAPANVGIQAAAGLGDAISNSFGHGGANYQKTLNENQNNIKAGALSALDTERAQHLQDMEGNQQMIMNDPNHPVAKAMQTALKSAGVNVPAGMPASVMLQVAGPLGELAYKQAMMGIQGTKVKADISNQQSGRREEAAKALTERPWYQKAAEMVPFMKSDATKELQSELKESDGDAKDGAPAHGIPDLGSTFNGGKVMKVTRIK